MSPISPLGDLGGPLPSPLDFFLASPGSRSASRNASRNGSTMVPMSEETDFQFQRRMLEDRRARIEERRRLMEEEEQIAMEEGNDGGPEAR